MHPKKILIISLFPLKPIRSGFQNTVYFLYKFLKKNKFNTKFFFIVNKNNIDPVLNLEIRNTKNIESVIESFKPDEIFINTTKLTFQLKKVINKFDIKPIIIIHDLYHFRKLYFKRYQINDKTPLSLMDELEVIKKSKFIIDFSIKEKKFLIKKKINTKKIIYTHTAIDQFKKKTITKKLNGILFVGSFWKQNENNINFLFRKKLNNFDKKKFIIIGKKLRDWKYKNIKFVSYSRKYFTNCKIGVAPIDYQTGRNVKIFEMISAGLPTFTNVSMSEYGLKHKKHYFKISNNNWSNMVEKYYNNNKLLKKISSNAKKWSEKRNNYNYAYKEILKKFNETK